ncbi:MAG TPA: protein kinase, partial [Gemmatimonadaceae bacterium]|nr:protein kinase [Gemmatimonadaceae bacterium]
MDPLEKLQLALADRYAVVREAGAGGMATVFLARDIKHDRHVALKVLRPELGAVLGVERFLSEIKVTAHLQHPHLLPLFDSGEADGLLFYVMPFVEGESLRVKLDAEHQLPIEEAIRITLAVASALDYAHKKGVIHRDLKPENILLQQGEPVISDFGIALAVSNAGGARVTQTGLSLGTPQYMSPEQATGDRIVDARSDIYSLAAVLYEMLTGEPPHSGKTAQAIIARVLTEKANSTRTMRETVPEHIDAAVLKALAKLPADRFASAADFTAALKNPSIMSGARDATRTGPPPGSRFTARGVRAALPWLIALAGVGFGFASWLGFGSRSGAAPATGAIARFDVTIPAAVGFGTPNSALEMSPDGSVMLVGSVSQRGIGLFVRTLDNPQFVHLAGTEGAGPYTAISPDNAWIAFMKGQTLMKIPRGGGPVVTLAEGVNISAGIAWGDGDRIVFAKAEAHVAARSGNGLWIMSSTGTDVRRLTTVDSTIEVGHGVPSFLPGGRAVLFATVQGVGGAGPIAVVTLDGKITRLPISGTSPTYTNDGHLVFFDLAGTVMSVPFD